MSSVLIVLPILSLLMFDLGLGLRWRDFAMVVKRPCAVMMGLIGQIILLPCIVFLLAKGFKIEGVMFVGLMLIACCPGGSSSNVFSGIARGDVALSVCLTALSSIITLVTLPLIMGVVVKLPVGSLIMQNIVLVLVPVLLGMWLRVEKPTVAVKLHAILGKLAFPLLMLLATLFFIGNRAAILDNFSRLGLIVTLLIVLAMAAGAILGQIGRLNNRECRTLVIEVGMQNAAQAIALATSPIVFNDALIAVPAIVYALMMNILLLAYVAIISKFTR